MRIEVGSKWTNGRRIVTVEAVTAHYVHISGVYLRLSSCEIRGFLQRYKPIEDEREEGAVAAVFCKICARIRFIFVTNAPGRGKHNSLWCNCAEDLD
jgi:hypothetical protein